ncbi:MAG: hypothetical protein J6Y88_06650, partial [Bacteroidales bacterium]|nr:hypothetical protein [Bacteroidales bacterium]
PQSYIRQLVAIATGCFWFSARRKLAFVREESQKQPVGRKANSCRISLCKGPRGERMGNAQPSGRAQSPARRNPGEGEGGPSKLAFVRPEHRKKHRVTKWRWCLWRCARAPVASGTGMRSPPGEHNPPPYNPKFAFSCIPSPKAL